MISSLQKPARLPIHALVHFLVLAPLLILTVLAYYPGLNGPFVLDDSGNIISNKAIAIHDLDLQSLHQAAWSNDTGPLKRPLASLSFAINHYFSGGFETSFGFKTTNLCIHLINTILVYFLSLALVHTPILKLSSKERLIIVAFTTALWALHPIQLTSVLYTVQRMNSLSALFVIAGLIAFVRGRQSYVTATNKGIGVMLCGVLLGTLLGLTSKENALLLPLFAASIEYIFFDRTRLSIDARTKLHIFYLGIVVIPAILFATYLIMHPELVLSAYAERNFTLTERLMTEARVLWFYVGLILLPDFRFFGLFHDDIPISTGILNPYDTLPAILGIYALLLFVLLRHKRYPVAGFSILWFMIGHVLESSIFGLEIAYEYRNYLPSFGIFFGVSYLAILLLRHTKVIRVGTWAFILLLLSLLTFDTWSLAGTWNNAYALAEHTVYNHPNSPQANDYAARTNLEMGYIDKAIRYLENGVRIAPNEVGFRLDMQIVLTSFAADVNDSISRTTGDTTKLTAVTISGLPPNIRWKTENGRLQLSTDVSSMNQIKQLLRNEPITVHGIISLDNLRECILIPPYRCRSLYPQALKWLIIAAANNKTSPEYHALISSNAAELLAGKEQYNKALVYITAAVDAAPDRIYYGLRKAEYLIQLGRLNEAKVLLNNISDNNPESRLQRGSHQNLYDKLLDRYRDLQKPIQ
ncbi:MAG: tetratricopeptide repeat protein [Sulfuricaulis sp.]|uniref:tetratricopeptide repeat protein n=1 Tax=Sulfuricaulis sp. TaxID=2003553 RepID=UPI0034A16978